MSYLVLARKYRPSTFSEVVGQEHVTRTLANAFASGRVHHAFLFCGPRGCGKTTVARIVGKALNCEQRLADRRAVRRVRGVRQHRQRQRASTTRRWTARRTAASTRSASCTEAVRYQPAVLTQEGLRHRRSPHAHDRGVQRAAEDARGAAAARDVRARDHRAAQAAEHDPVALPALRLQARAGVAARAAPRPRSSSARQLAIDAGAVSLLVRESGGSVRDALSLCDQIISYVGESRRSPRRTSPRCSASPIAR